MTIKIHGKDYMMVHERIAVFRGEYKDYGLKTEIISHDNEIVLMKAIVINQDGQIISTGHAQEWQDDPSSKVNKGSYIENCETSAIGRVLGNLGIGININEYILKILIYIQHIYTKQIQNKK